MKAATKQRLRDAWRRLRGGELTPGRAAASVAIGIAVGVTPLWGVHWAIVLAVCLPLRLDAGVAYLASNISLPFIAPFITFAEIAVGARVLHGAWPTIGPDDVKNVRFTSIVGELALGTVVVALGGALVGALLAYGLATVWRARSRKDVAG